MIEYDDPYCGNGNGNKFNLRVQMLENLLQASGDGTSAKVNSLRQAIHRSKTDMAESLGSSLDLLRQVFQAEMTEEIRQVMDRHIRTTFSPALENLRRNGFEIRENDLNDLCVNILEAAKEPFVHPDSVETERLNRTIIPSDTLLKPKLNYTQANTTFESRRNMQESEGNESDSSLASFSNTSQFGGNVFNRPKKRGRPRKTDVDTGRCGSPLMNGTQQVTLGEAFKWNPDRIQIDSRFVLGSKVNKLLSMGHRGHIFVKYPRIYRYVADEEDKSWLFDRNISTRMSGKVFFMLLEDVMELTTLENASPSIRNDFQRCSFLIPEKIIAKMKVYMGKPFELLKTRIAPASPLHINPNGMISSPSPSIISTEAAMTNMALQHGQHGQHIRENGREQSVESMVNNLNSIANNALMNGSTVPTTNSVNDNLHLTNSLINLLHNSNNQQLLNQHGNSMNGLQQNGQPTQQDLINALAHQQQNSNGTNPNYSFVQ